MMPTIRSLREARGWTQAQLANAVGVSAVSVYQWEAGRKVPHSPHLRKLAEVFGVSMEDVTLQSEPVSRPVGRPRKDAR